MHTGGIKYMYMYLYRNEYMYLFVFDKTHQYIAL